MNKKAYCIMSGGMDSSLSAVWAKKKQYDEIESLFFDWGQKSAEKELKAVKAICKSLSIKVIEEIKVPISDWDKSSLTKGDRDIISNDNFMVPERNLIFISIAASYVRAKGGGHLIVGFNKDDGGYDTKQDFVDQLNTLFQDGNKELKNVSNYLLGTEIELVAPLLKKNKLEIKGELEEMGLFSLTYSCYAANGPCMKCKACKNRNPEIFGNK